MAKLIQTDVRTDFNNILVNNAFFVPNIGGPLRNYISIRLVRYNIHGDDGMGGTIDIPTTSCGADDEDLKLNVDINIAFQEAINDPGHIYTWGPITYDPITTIYWQLDKANFVIFSNYIADLLWLGSVNTVIPQFAIAKAKLGTDYSPRKGWTDDVGVKRSPPPSEALKKGNFTGVKTLLDFLNNLPLLAANLRRAGKIREAGIVSFAYNQVVEGLWTITLAFDYLRQNRII